MASMRIVKITSGAEYQMSEQFQNLPIFLNFKFSKLKIFRKFGNF